MRELGITYTAAERRALTPDDGSRTPPHGDALMDVLSRRGTAESMAACAAAYLCGYADALDRNGGDASFEDAAVATAYADGRVAGERARATRSLT